MKAKVGVIALFVCGLLWSPTMHSIIVGSKLVILPHSGAVTFVDQRVLFRESVEGFLQPSGA
jgi:hypothetical protein